MQSQRRRMAMVADHMSPSTAQVRPCARTCRVGMASAGVVGCAAWGWIPDGWRELRRDDMRCGRASTDAEPTGLANALVTPLVEARPGERVERLCGVCTQLSITAVCARFLPARACCLVGGNTPRPTLTKRHGSHAGGRLQRAAHAAHGCGATKMDGGRAGCRGRHRPAAGDADEDVRSPLVTQ